MSASKKTAAVARAVFAEHGLSLNFDPGKSACLMHFAGPKSTDQKRKVYQEWARRIPCEDGDVKFHLSVEHTHKHSGRVYAESGSFRPEAKNRARDLWSGMTKAERHFFRSEAIPRHKRIEVLKTLVLSKVLYNSGTWPALHPFPLPFTARQPQVRRSDRSLRGPQPIGK